MTQRLSVRRGVLIGLLSLVLLGRQSLAFVQLEVQALSVHGQSALQVEDQIRSGDLLQSMFQPVSVGLSAGYQPGVSGGFQAAAPDMPLATQTTDVLERLLPVVWQFHVPADLRGMQIKVEASWIPSSMGNPDTRNPASSGVLLDTDRPRLVTNTEQGDIFEVTARMRIPVAFLHHPDTLSGRVRLEVYLQ